MRLLFAVPCYHPATRFGGPIKSIHELARGLAALGHDVSVFTTNSNGPDDLRVRLEVETDIDGVKVVYFPVEWPRGYFHSPRLAAALHDRVASFELVYAAWMYVHPTGVAARACRHHRVPLVISPRGMLDQDAIRQRSRLKKLAYLRLVGRAAMAGAQAIHFTSPGERERCIIPIEPERSLVVANGVALATTHPAIDVKAELVRLGIPHDRPLVLFLGRLSYIKGLDLLSRAWPQVHRKSAAAHLVIAGPDDEGLGPPLRDSFQCAGVAQSVSFVGMVEGAAKAALMRHCSLLVSPSYLESFGMSIVEAMAAGKPVVVTDRVNIARDIVAAGAGLMTRCDSEEIAAAIVRLLGDPELSASMGRSGRILVETEYSLPGTTRKMSTAFLSIAAKTQPPS